MPNWTKNWLPGNRNRVLNSQNRLSEVQTWVQKAQIWLSKVQSWTVEPQNQGKVDSRMPKLYPQVLNSIQLTPQVLKSNLRGLKLNKKPEWTKNWLPGVQNRVPNATNRLSGVQSGVPKAPNWGVIFWNEDGKNVIFCPILGDELRCDFLKWKWKKFDILPDFRWRIEVWFS